MSDGLNKWLGLGRLTEDPTFRMTQDGQAVLNMRIACNESYLDRNKQRKERTEFVTCVVWGRRAETLSKFLSKGKQLFVEGGLRASSYDDRDGNKRWKTEVVVSNVVLCGGRGRREETQNDHHIRPHSSTPICPAFPSKYLPKVGITLILNKRRVCWNQQTLVIYGGADETILKIVAKIW